MKEAVGSYIQETRWISPDQIKLLPQEILPLGKDPQGFLWLDIRGEVDKSLLAQIQEKFTLHPQMIHSIIDHDVRPRAHVFEDYLSLVVKHLHWNEEEDEIEIEHICFVLGPQVVMSFQNLEGDAMEAVKELLELPKGKARRNGADFFLVVLLRNSLKHYFELLELLNDRLEELEVALSDDPQPSHLQQIQLLKKAVLKVRKAIFPLQEMFKQTFAVERYPVSKRLIPHITDLQSQAQQIWDVADAIYQQLTVLQDLYLALINHRTNEIVRLLTLFSAIFLPLGFLAGVFGMNFVHMPGLDSPYGFWLLVGIWVLMAGGMLGYFRYKKWL
ncbi:MAG: CorA family divalent cation transporter [Bacteroidota bacterium]